MKLASMTDLSFDIVSVLPGQLFLSSCRDEDITFGFQNVSLIGMRVREAHNSAMLLKRKTNMFKKQFQYGPLTRISRNLDWSSSLYWPVYSPPALLGLSRWGSKCCRRSQRFQHTWHHNGEGTAWNADPHYRNPERERKHKLSNNELWGFFCESAAPVWFDLALQLYLCKTISIPFKTIETVGWLSVY